MHLGNLMAGYHRVSMMFEALSGTFGLWYVITDQGLGVEKMYFEDSKVARLWIKNHPEATVIDGPKHEISIGLSPGFEFTSPGKKPTHHKQRV